MRAPGLARDARLLILAGAVLFGSALGSPTVAAGPGRIEHRASVEVRPVVFKVCDVFDAFADRDGFRILGLDLDAETEALLGSCEVRPAFGQPRALLDRWWREADERLPEHLERPGRLANWFEARLIDPGSDPNAGQRHLASQLGSLFFVDEATVLPEVVACGPGVFQDRDDEREATPDFRGLQTWFDDAPVGFGLQSLRALDGVRGDHVRVFHVEADWDVDHEDLQSLGKYSFVRPAPPGLERARNHGTGVLGVLFATDNGIGVTGIVDQAEGRLSCEVAAGGTHKALVELCEIGDPGDVVVLIGQINVGLQHEKDFVPVEIFRINFDAILTVTTQGLHVVEAAGNGGNDLDDERFLGLFDRGVRDSGAILVTASQGADPALADFANHGSRCDLTGYGDQVVTTGYGGLFRTGDPHRAYAYQYAGTSAGTATIGGFVASVVGALRTQGVAEPSPFELRDALRIGGTRVRGGLAPRPDLGAVLRHFGLPRGLITESEHVRGSLRLAFPGFAGRPALVLGSTRTLGARPASGLALDPDHLWPAFSLSSLPAVLDTQVPPHPNLLGHDFFVQVLSREAGAGFELSSTIEVSVRF